MREQAVETIRVGLALRDAILAAECWEDVEPGLRKRGADLDIVRRRLAPLIGFDPHNHTVYSDALFTYRQLVWWVKAVGLEAIGVTDHDNIHPDIAGGIDEAARLGVQLVPGLEFTIHRLGGQAWKGLEVGLHFFPSDRFAEFVRSEEGRQFCRRFEVANRLKSEQGWGAMEAVNARLLIPNGLPPVSRDELWEASGRVDPVCPSMLTVLTLSRMFETNRQDLLERFPDTRAIYTHMHREGLVPPLNAPPQTLDDVAAIREAVRPHGIRSTLTLNHPEEWLSKCGLTLEDGSADVPAIRRLIALMVLHEPRRCPVSFIELYSSRNTPETRELFTGPSGSSRTSGKPIFRTCRPCTPSPRPTPTASRAFCTRTARSRAG
ncbi:hypothetical protein HQ520_15175 [bacterium]|nr:hypothetical protein [bacterium]